jgi:hypothetical protein
MFSIIYALFGRVGWTRGRPTSRRMCVNHGGIVRVHAKHAERAHALHLASSKQQAGTCPLARGKPIDDRAALR